MTTMQVNFNPRETVGTALIAEDGSVWIAVNPPPYDLATWIWWWLCPSSRKARIKLNTTNGIVSTRAIKIARRHVRLGTPKTEPGGLPVAPNEVEDDAAE